MNCILTYTSLTMDDILNLTYVQFGNTVEGVGKKISWELKVGLASLCPDIKDEDFPLYSKPAEDQKFRIKDAMALQNMSANQ